MKSVSPAHLVTGLPIGSGPFYLGTSKMRIALPVADFTMSIINATMLPNKWNGAAICKERLSILREHHGVVERV
jgi:hypothetical protein